MSTKLHLNLPQRQRRYRIALTPLADAMFQLLIFFMLSSNLTPYSLLTLQSAAGSSTAAGPNGDSTEPPQAPFSGNVALWTIEAETVIVGGQRFGFDMLEDLAAALGQDDTPTQVVLVIRPSAQVQDVTTVLARLQTADVVSVRVASGRI